ncbi:MAG TPA: DUF1499 domain-containing protein [Abditibacteriaceae bacterium]|jgi:uncharacterized protein (DUF1499 family)
MSNPTNFAATRPDHSDLQLRTRVYGVAAADAVSAVREIIPRLRTYGRLWRMETSSIRRDTVVVTCEVPVLFFTDDLKVTVHAQGVHAQVDVESRSRVGRGDFGENRRHIIQLLHALDAKLNERMVVG